MTPNPCQRTAHLGARCALLLLGMFVASCGLACATRANLGTTPISSLPFVLSKFLPLTFGEFTFVVSSVLVFMQWLILGKDFPHKNWLQIPCVWFFGMFIDFSMALFAGISAIPEKYGYPWAIAMNLTGNVLLALGVVMQVESHTLVQPGEGLSLAISQRFHEVFGNVKIGVDCTVVASSILCSFVFLDGLQGVREGTLLSALTVGLFVKGWYWIFRRARIVCNTR